MSETMVLENIFTLEEIAKLKEYFANAPVGEVERNGTVNKHLDYQLPYSLCHRIIKPKVDRIIGEHKIGSGSYKECQVPYGVHYDNTNSHNARHTVLETSVDKNKVLLIPLVEGPEFSTVTFNVFSDEVLPMNLLVDESELGDYNGLDLEQFGHLPEESKKQVVRLPVDVQYNWRLGDMLVWRRDQLHTSTNFLRFGKTVKKFIVIFLA